MRSGGIVACSALLWACGSALAQDSAPVNPDNFPRAESDLHFSAAVRDGALGKWRHQRAPAGPEKSTTPHPDRNTLSSEAVFDLAAGPVTITLPDAASRYLSLQIVDEDGYTPQVVYGAQAVTLTKNRFGTRYVLAVLRIYVDANDLNDVAAADALQDATVIDQPGGPGVFSAPNWDAASEVDVRTGLRVLAETLTDAKGLSGARGEVDPVRRLIGTAAAWGALPERDLLVLQTSPERNDGATAYRLRLKNVPVSGFWSISVYNSRGFFEPNALKAYSVSSPAAKPDPEGGVTIQFGGCDVSVPDCLPTPPDWSLFVRLYRPAAEALSGAWTLPKLEEIARPAPPPGEAKANASGKGGEGARSASTPQGKAAATASAPPSAKTPRKQK